MNQSVGDYEELDGVDSVYFDGSTDTVYNGTVEIEIDDSARQVWFKDVPLADILDGAEYGIDAVYAVSPDGELSVKGNEQEVLDTKWFSGAGFEMTDGPVVYIEHPTHFGRGNGEGGAGHEHVRYFLNGRVETDAQTGRETVEDAVEFGNQVLEDIEQAEAERVNELLSEWDEETGYSEKGFFGRLWLRLTNRPKGLGPKHVNPKGCILDMEGYGLSGEQLIEASDRI